MRVIQTTLNKFVKAQDDMKEAILTAVFANPQGKYTHILIDGPPGTGKTLICEVFSRLCAIRYNRVQMTPDMLPNDLIGGLSVDSNSGTFTPKQNFRSIFCNLLLADEINRTPPKTQSALLSAMAELKTVMDNKVYDLGYDFGQNWGDDEFINRYKKSGYSYKIPNAKNGNVFIVLATQNPFEHEGTYTLPEAQMDRFLIKFNQNYPEDFGIVTDLSVGNYYDSLYKSIHPFEGNPDDFDEPNLDDVILFRLEEKEMEKIRSKAIRTLKTIVAQIEKMLKKNEANEVISEINESLKKIENNLSRINPQTVKAIILNIEKSIAKLSETDRRLTVHDLERTLKVDLGRFPKMELEIEVIIENLEEISKKLNSIVGQTVYTEIINNLLQLIEKLNQIKNVNDLIDAVIENIAQYTKNNNPDDLNKIIEEIRKCLIKFKYEQVAHYDRLDDISSALSYGDIVDMRRVIAGAVRIPHLVHNLVEDFYFKMLRHPEFKSHLSVRPTPLILPAAQFKRFWDYVKENKNTDLENFNWNNQKDNLCIRAKDVKKCIEQMVPHRIILNRGVETGNLSAEEYIRQVALSFFDQLVSSEKYKDAFK